jgi:hypothetical protein
MGRDIAYPPTAEIRAKLAELLPRLNKFQRKYGKNLAVSSGYRPGPFNGAAHGAVNSPHLTCEACDFHDVDGALKKFILANPEVLEECDLYMEAPLRTPTWVHLQSRRVPSGNRIFTP